MGKSCCVVGCTNNERKDRLSKSKTAYHRIPCTSRISLRSQWLIAINRDKDGKLYSPKKFTYVCGRHFVSGRASKNPHDVDYVPSCFMSKIDKTPSKLTGRNVRKKIFLVNPPTRTTVEIEPVKVIEPDKPSSLDQISNTTTSIPCSTPSTCTTVEIEPLNVIKPDQPSNLVQISNTSSSIPSSTPTNLSLELNYLRMEKRSLKRKLLFANDRIRKLLMSVVKIRDDNKRCKMYTGLSSYHLFQHLFTFCEPSDVKRSTSISLETELLMTLEKLRLNTKHSVLADNYGLNLMDVSVIFHKWIDILYVKIGWFISKPPKNVITATMPFIFKKKFPKLTQIIDCFELYLERPARSLLLSRYIKHHTVKVFIACSPLGQITFVSKCGTECMSDDMLIRQSGFINEKYHDKGDTILADRSFTLDEDFSHIGVNIVTPAFTTRESQRPAKEDNVSRKISSVRIHLKKIIGRVRRHYSILSPSAIPINMLLTKKDTIKKRTVTMDKIVMICCALTNLSRSVVLIEKK